MKQYIKLLSVAALAIGLTACGKTDEEKRAEQAVQAQALGCITSEEAKSYRTAYDADIHHEIQVCKQQERNRKSDIYVEQRHEERMAYYEAEMLDELDDITENLAYTNSRPIAPISPGEYYSRIGDNECGYWIAGRWEWYDEDSMCANQNRRYYDYMVITGAIVAADLYRVRNYNYHNSWKSRAGYKNKVFVNNYYGSGGKIITQSTYNNQKTDYTQRRNAWKTSRNTFRQSDTYKTAFVQAKQKDTRFDQKTVQTRVTAVKSGQFKASDKPKPTSFQSQFAKAKDQNKVVNQGNSNTTATAAAVSTSTKKPTDNKDTKTDKTATQFKSQFAKDTKKTEVKTEKPTGQQAIQQQTVRKPSNATGGKPKNEVKKNTKKTTKKTTTKKKKPKKKTKKPKKKKR